MSQTTSHRGTGEAAVIGPDWSKVSKDEMALYIGRLEDSLRMASETQADLRAEVEMARHSLHDIQKPGALNHFASRWDQINGILGAAGIEPDPDNWVNDVHTLVTERDQLRAEVERLRKHAIEYMDLSAVLENERDQLRAELERVRSCMKTTFWVSAYDDSGYGDDRSKEFSDEGEALSYAKSLGDSFMPSVSKRMSFALNASELIYSRAAPSQLKQPPIEPIPGTTAALAKLTIRGVGHE